MTVLNIIMYVHELISIIIVMESHVLYMLINNKYINIKTQIGSYTSQGKM